MSTKRRKHPTFMGIIRTMGLFAIGPVVLAGNVKTTPEDAATVTCPGLGRAVTMLLTLSEPGHAGEPGPVDYMTTLLDNSVRWAGKDVPGMRVLVVRDDNHSGEWTSDTDAIRNTLAALGYHVSLLDEPPEGLAYEDIEGYDVVLLSNPGWPVDDLLTVQSLQQFFYEGGGVILQGDDISQSGDPVVQGLLQVLTGLKFIDNGTIYFGHSTDMQVDGDFYTVTITNDHPVTASLDGVSFSYGDDIDGTQSTDSTVLAQAAIEDHPSKPVIAVREAAVTIGGLIQCKERCFERGCIDNKGTAQSLDQKLNAAKAALDRNQPQTAVNILQAFINELEAQSGKHVSPRCASLLTAYAERLIIQETGKDPKKALVGHWKLDEKKGSIADDSSGNDNDGLLYGNPVWQPKAGAVQGALLLDGVNDCVDLPIGSLIGSLTDSTVATWVNWSSQNVWQRIFDFGSGTEINMFLTPCAGTGQLRFAITTGGGGAEDQTTASAALPTGWHHVAVTIDADSRTHSLYLDGAVVAQKTAARYTPSSLGNTTQNWLGRSQYTGDAYYKGSLDDFRIYDQALSPGEIQTIMGDD